MIPLAIDFSNLLTTALGVLALATAAGLGLVRSNVTILRENLKDAREEIADKDRRHTEFETRTATQIAELEAKLLAKGADLDALSRVVTGEAHWVALGETLDVHHAAAEQHWETIEALITSLLEVESRRTT